ncbi:MAG: type II toxin-antitoxin system RelE/ParE family toxin [Gemmatimonadetes bacterium]|nr:type II toxin-antitoxin system RelE/ParE family toxin [Gemmatimonadota bacterium]
MSARSERRFVVRPQAGREIEEAAEWYDNRRSGLGSEFLDAVDTCIASVLQSPELHPEVRSGIRRAVLRRFPYNLVYVPRPGEVVVLGCVHGRRNPKIWQNRA